MRKEEETRTKLVRNCLSVAKTLSRVRGIDDDDDNDDDDDDNDDDDDDDDDNDDEDDVHF